MLDLDEIERFFAENQTARNALTLWRLKNKERLTVDEIDLFLAEHCVRERGTEVRSSALMGALNAWRVARGRTELRTKMLAPVTERLNALGFVRRLRSDGVIFVGIRLADGGKQDGKITAPVMRDITAETRRERFHKAFVGFFEFGKGERSTVSIYKLMLAVGGTPDETVEWLEEELEAAGMVASEDGTMILNCTNRRTDRQ